MVTLLARNLNQYEQTVLNEYFRGKRGIPVPYHLVNAGKPDWMYEVRSVDKFVSYEKDTHAMLIASNRGSGSNQEMVVAEWGSQSSGNNFETIERAVAERVTEFVRYDVDDLASVFGIFGGGFAMMAWLTVVANTFPGWSVWITNAPMAAIFFGAIALAAVTAIVFAGGMALIRHLHNTLVFERKLSKHPVLQLIRSHSNSLGLENGVAV